MDLFSSPYSSPFQQEEMVLGETFFWQFSPEPFDLTPAAPSPIPPPSPRSAFARYIRPDCSSSRMSNERKNIHCRVIELLRRIPGGRPESRAGECSRGFRHMMRERQRRERLSQSYADLHSMLPYGSKPDKNSIVQSAAAYVGELKGAKEALMRRSEELKARSARESSSAGAKKIKIRAASPSSTIDSMIGALRCLKAMDAKATAVQTEFSGHELTAIVSIESKVGACEVERALVESWR